MLYKGLDCSHTCSSPSQFLLLKPNVLHSFKASRLSSVSIKHTFSLGNLTWKIKKPSYLNLSSSSVNDVADLGQGGNPPGDGNKNNSGGGGNGDDDHGDHSSPIQWYLFYLEKYPVRTKAITSALLNLAGDLICQFLVEGSPTLDAKRALMFTILGLVLVGPTLHFWYFSLSKIVAGSGAVKAGLRLLLDQFAFSPLFIGVFFSALLSLEGRPADIFPKLKQDWFASVVANWKLWIPFQFVNFLVVPQQLQVLAANVIALAWNVYLSFSSHKKLSSSKSSV